VLRLVTAAYDRGFRNGMDASLFILANAEPPIPIEELARACNDLPVDTMRAIVEHGADVFVAREEGRREIVDVEMMSEATGGLLFETVDIARTKFQEKVAEEDAKLGAPRHIAPASTDATASEPARCVQCGVKLPPAPETGGRPRRYCSARCRKAHWTSGL